MNETKPPQNMFIVFNRLNVTGELVIESLGWIHGGEEGGGETGIIPRATKYSLYSNNAQEILRVSEQTTYILVVFSFRSRTWFY